MNAAGAAAGTAARAVGSAAYTATGALGREVGNVVPIFWRLVVGQGAFAVRVA